MKKFLCIIALALAFVMGADAQVAPAKFFDNTSIELKGGINTPLEKPFEGISEQVGVQIEKGITPWLSFAIDGKAFIHQPYRNNPHTAFDGVNVNGLVKFNLFNLFGNYPGYRRHFEWNVFTGLGWSHRTCKDYPLFGHRNFGNYIAGTDLQFNLGKEKAWALVLTPEVNWGMPETGKLDKNKAMLEVNVGIVYRFKNKDGNRYFTKAKLYNQEEVNNLNSRINHLIASNETLLVENTELKNTLENIPTSVTETVEVMVEKPYYVLPPVQFLFNSAVISETSYAAVNEIANVILTTPSNYVITGYASNEGTEEYNIGLSQERADAMKNALVNCGVNPDRLTTKAGGITTKFSETEPSLNRIVTVNVE